MRVQQEDAIKHIVERMIRTGLEYTDLQIHTMFVTYYNIRQSSETRKDFTKAIDKVRKIVKEKISL